MKRAAAVLAVAAACLGVIVLGAPAANAAPGPADAQEYWFDTWHVNSLWDSGADGSGITIAEIDTGVNASLDGLSGRILSGSDFGAGGDGQTDRDSDQFGHGTAMASIMVSRPSAFDVTGLAPGAKILPVAVPLIGTTDEQGDDHLDQAIRWAADHGAKIISMSLGGERKASSGGQACYPDEQDAIFYALRKGALLFAASGNGGDKGNPVEEPGVCLGVVSVGAVDRSGKVAAFSSRHPYLTMTAPGVNVPSLSRIPGEAYSGDGTSQATALASAAAALVWSKLPSLTAQQVLTRLIATTDHHQSRPSSSYGYGIVNPYRAITASSVPSTAPNPVYAKAQPFLARFAVLGKPTVTTPPPPVSHAAPPGSYRVASAPNRFGAQVIAGGTAALVGLLALIALTVGGVRGNRWRARALAAARARASSPLPPPVVDVDGVEWHQL